MPIGTVTFASNRLSLTIQTQPWWHNLDYAFGWRNNLKQLSVPVQGMNISVICKKELVRDLTEALVPRSYPDQAPARGYSGLLEISINDTPVLTSVPQTKMPAVILFKTDYQGNRLVIGLQSQRDYQMSPSIVINWYGQLVHVDQPSYFRAYLQVRKGKPLTMMSPTRRGAVNDDLLKNLRNFIRDGLMTYFKQTPANKISADALHNFYREHSETAQTLPYFVAARRKDYKNGNGTEMTQVLGPLQVCIYDQSPLLLADEVRVVREDGSTESHGYGLHSFLKLTGAAYKVQEANVSRLPVKYLYWKPGSQISPPEGCSPIFYETGYWGLGTASGPPEEWHEVGSRLVFTFNKLSTQDVTDAGFIVGSTQPRRFYQNNALAGFDYNDSYGATRKAKLTGYRRSCERESRKFSGQAVPKNFSWSDLSEFIPEGQQVISIGPEYRKEQDRQPTAMTLILSNGKRVKLKLL